MYKDMNDLAYDANRHIEDAVGWLEDFNQIEDGDPKGECREALESAADFLSRAGSALHDYAHETREVPESEWTAIDHANQREMGYTPQRDVLLDQSFAPQAEFSSKLYRLESELRVHFEEPLESVRAAKLETFDCAVAELSTRLKMAFEAVAPAVYEVDGSESGPGFDYHPKC